MVIWVKHHSQHVLGPRDVMWYCFRDFSMCSEACVKSPAYQSHEQICHSIGKLNTVRSEIPTVNQLHDAVLGTRNLEQFEFPFATVD